LDPLRTPASGDGIDDFFEIWTPGADWDAGTPAENLEAFDCDPNKSGVQSSPRNITLIVIEELGAQDGEGCAAGGNAKCTRVEGCITGSTFSATCSGSGGGGSLTIVGRFVEQVTISNAELGIVEDFGSDIEVFLKD